MEVQDKNTEENFSWDSKGLAIHHSVNWQHRLLWDLRCEN